MITKREVRDALNAEKKWCIENKNEFNMSEEFQDGFIEGLKQAIRILNQI